MIGHDLFERGLNRPPAPANAHGDRIEQFLNPLVVVASEHVTSKLAGLGLSCELPADALLADLRRLTEPTLEQTQTWRWADLASRYPVLVWLLSERLERWSQSLVSARIAIAEDTAAIADLVRDRTPPRVLALRDLGGDLHDGQRPLKVETSGAPLVFKPRCLTVEATVRRIAAELAMVEVVPKHWTNNERGYCVFVQSSRLNPERAPFHAGRLHALAWLLGVRDLHVDNIVPGTSSLVAVDLESSFVGTSPVSNDDADTGILPRNERFIRDCWLSELPTPPGTSETDRAINQFLQGVSFVLDRAKKSRRRIDGLVTAVGPAQVRVVVRPTRVYARALRRAVEPEALESPTARLKACGKLETPLPQGWEELRRGEIRSLFNGEIPRVVATATGRSLDCDGALVHDALEESGATSVARRLERIEALEPSVGRQAESALRLLWSGKRA